MDTATWLRSASAADLLAASRDMEGWPPARRNSLLSSSEPLAAAVLEAARQCGDPFPVLTWLASVTDIRPPPSEDFVRHFSTLGPLLESSLSSGCSIPLRRCSFQVLRHLGRGGHMLRRQLAPNVLEHLLKALRLEALRASAAAALCNLASEPSVRVAALPAVPLLLQALPNTEELEADDMVAALGVLAQGETNADLIESMVQPLLGQLPRNSSILTSTVLEVLSDLTKATGPGGAVAPILAADSRLANALSRSLEISQASSLTTSLRLCVLLQDFPSFNQNFQNAGGEQVLRGLQQRLSFEEMRNATRGYFGGLGGFSKKFCQMSCVDPSCNGANCEMPMLDGKAPPRDCRATSLLHGDLRV